MSMKYIKLFERILTDEELRADEESEETLDQKEYNKLMGKILHLYSSIPLIKQDSQVVIKKILYPNYFSLKDTDNGNPEDVDLTHDEEHDKARFAYYFKSLLSSKDTRGDNFEGFLAGVYYGKLSKPQSKFDVTIEGLTWSVKFIDKPFKAPEIGSFEKELSHELKQNIHLKSKYDSYGLREIFKSSGTTLKEQVWEAISLGITGGWLIAYPNGKDIRVNKIDVDTMKHLLMEGYTTSPKGGWKSIYSLAISSKFRNFISKEDSRYRTKHFDIIIPELNLNDLKNIYINADEEAWGHEIFGEISNKIRPDVLKDIRLNQNKIGKKLLNFGKFKSS